MEEVIINRSEDNIISKMKSEGKINIINKINKINIIIEINKTLYLQ
jgi:hypothetical protein